MQSTTTKKLTPVIVLHFCVRIPDLLFFLSGATFAGLYPGFLILVAEHTLSPVKIASLPFMIILCLDNSMTA